MHGDPIFEAHDIEAMNETDVREVIVRPLLRRLGYRQGSSANIRTELTLSYGKLFLGRKKDSDRDLRGRADYICEVLSAGKWVVEVKGPDQPLTLEDAHQAHSYAAHPEVAGLFSLLTNGREFRLYRTSQPETPILTWNVDQTEGQWVKIANLLSPAAIERLVRVPSVVGKPLGIGIDSRAELVGGGIIYRGGKINGVRLSVASGHLHRVPDDRIECEFRLNGPFDGWDSFNKAAGIERYLLVTSAEYLSTAVELPTVFQGSFLAVIPRGTPFPNFPFTVPQLDAQYIQRDLSIFAQIEAVGFVDANNFKGTFEIAYFLDPDGSETAPIVAPHHRTQGEFDFVIR